MLMLFSCRYFEFFLLEYKGFPINACIFAALVLSCIFQCIISGARKASSIGRDGRESCEVMWNYCLVFSFLCVVGILCVPLPVSKSWARDDWLLRVAGLALRSC